MLLCSCVVHYGIQRPANKARRTMTRHASAHVLDPLSTVYLASAHLLSGTSAPNIEGDTSTHRPRARPPAPDRSVSRFSLPYRAGATQIGNSDRAPSPSDRSPGPRLPDAAGAMDRWGDGRLGRSLSYRAGPFWILSAFGRRAGGNDRVGALTVHLMQNSVRWMLFKVGASSFVDARRLSVSKVAGRHPASHDSLDVGALERIPDHDISSTPTWSMEGAQASMKI